MASERGSGVSFQRSRRNPRWCVAALACLFNVHPALAGGEAPAEPSERLDRLTLVAASHPGGGWDSTAQAMKQVLEAEGIVRSVEIEHIPGHGGLIGLASFASSRRGDGQSLLIGGMLMVGAAVSKHVTNALNELTPIAQLTSDADVVVVPASSPYRSLDDLLAALRSNPEAIRWVGGSVGGSDHPTMWLLARAAGVAPELMRYESFPSASEVATRLAGGEFSAGINGYREFERLIRSGQLRGLALVSRQPIEGVNIPTFRQLGIVGTSINNWFGVFAPPAISENDRSRLDRAVRQMVQSPGWRTALKQYHLRSTYLDAAEFSQLVAEEQTRISKSEAIASAGPNLRLLPSRWKSRLDWALALAGGMLTLVMALGWQRLAARRREENLGRALQELSQEVEQRTREALQRTQDMAAVRVGMNAQIEREFDRWGLTCAERSVAHLTLKGLRLKEIAGARNTSDRTVRQQAQAIYRKAGLDGRTDLAAYFLESVLGAPELDPVANAPAAPAVRPPLPVEPPLQVAPGRVSDRIKAISKPSRQHAYRRTTVHKPPGLPLTAVADSR
jgi:putative tricarboxylic transport membrane protein